MKFKVIRIWHEVEADSIEDLVIRRHVPYFGAAGCRWCGGRAALELIANQRTAGYGCQDHAGKWVWGYL